MSVRRKIVLYSMKGCTSINLAATAVLEAITCQEGLTKICQKENGNEGITDVYLLMFIIMLIGIGALLGIKLAVVWGSGMAEESLKYLFLPETEDPHPADQQTGDQAPPPPPPI